MWPGFHLNKKKLMVYSYLHNTIETKLFSGQSPSQLIFTSCSLIVYHSHDANCLFMEFHWNPSVSNTLCLALKAYPPGVAREVSTCSSSHSLLLILVTLNFTPLHSKEHCCPLGAYQRGRTWCPTPDPLSPNLHFNMILWKSPSYLNCSDFYPDAIFVQVS